MPDQAVLLRLRQQQAKEDADAAAAQEAEAALLLLSPRSRSSAIELPFQAPKPAPKKGAGKKARALQGDDSDEPLVNPDRGVHENFSSNGLAQKLTQATTFRIAPQPIRRGAQHNRRPPHRESRTTK